MAKRKKNKQKADDSGKPFFVHTFTDEGITSDLADTRRAYEEAAEDDD